MKLSAISSFGFGVSKARRAAAFTMVEIALCLGIIGFALVAIIGVLPTGMSVQKDNREDTVINFDAAYLMDAIRNGARGQDDLTNHVMTITVRSYAYNITTNDPPLNGPNGYVCIFTNDAASPTGPNYNLRGIVYPAASPDPLATRPFLNGFNLIGMLSTPKYIFFDSVFATTNANATTNFQSFLGNYYPSGTLFISNYVTADIRPISETATEQGSSRSARDFAFKYRVVPEIVPFDPGMMDANWTNTLISGLSSDETNSRTSFRLISKNLRANLNQIRLNFTWPVYPNGTTGNGHQTFRSAAGGSMAVAYLVDKTPSVSVVQNEPIYFILPQTFTAQPLLP